MAKIKSLFKYNGTFQGVTVVNSRTYGEHIRAARGTHKPPLVNAAFKKSGEIMTVANGYAKGIKDAFEPFREDFKDGTMWYRLVSLFKLQLQDMGYVDLSKLEGFQFYKRNPLTRLFFRNVLSTVSVQNKALELTAKTACHFNLDKEKAESYQQTLIAVFYTRDFQAVACDESAIFPLTHNTSHEQHANFVIPDLAATSVVALKCDLFREGKSMELASKKGMEIVKVLDVASV